MILQQQFLTPFGTRKPYKGKHVDNASLAYPPPGDGGMRKCIINEKYGRGTLKLSQDGARQKWKAKQERKSPEYTTNCDEIPSAFAR